MFEGIIFIFASLLLAVFGCVIWAMLDTVKKDDERNDIYKEFKKIEDEFKREN